jgi:transcription-repair coupling factor (superfamily II helicase)
VVLAAWSEGSGERLEGILRDHELKPLAWARSWAEVAGRHLSIVSLVVLRLETGFETDDLAVIAEQDILGDRLIRSTRRARKASDVISELSSLSPVTSWCMSIMASAALRACAPSRCKVPRMTACS